MSSRLSSGLPGTTAGPVSPPFRRPSRLSTSKLALSFSAVFEWHLAHDVMSTGRILVSKNLVCSGVSGRLTWRGDGLEFRGGFSLGHGGLRERAGFFREWARSFLGEGALAASGSQLAQAAEFPDRECSITICVQAPKQAVLNLRSHGFLGGILLARPVGEQLAELVERELAVQVSIAK